MKEILKRKTERERERETERERGREEKDNTTNTLRTNKLLKDRKGGVSGINLSLSQEWKKQGGEHGTICSGSRDPFHIVSYYIKCVTTSWTHSTKTRW